MCMPSMFYIFVFKLKPWSWLRLKLRPPSWHQAQQLRKIKSFKRLLLPIETGSIKIEKISWGLKICWKLDWFIWQVYLTGLFDRFIWLVYLTGLFDRFIWQFYLTGLFDRYWHFVSKSHYVLRLLKSSESIASEKGSVNIIVKLISILIALNYWDPQAQCKCASMVLIITFSLML